LDEVENVRLLGGYGGELSNNGERVQLQRPDEPPPEEPTLIPRLFEDEVLYDDLAPWDNSAGGEGDTLQRRGPDLYGNFANSWLAATPSPGMVDFDTGIPGDLTGDGVVDAADINTLFAAINAGDPPAEFDLDGNSVVDQLDVRFLVQDILGTFLGDANLDGRVNAADLNQVGLNWRETNVMGWELGDFNGDGFVNAMDLNILGLNWRNGEAVAAAAAGNSAQQRISPPVVDGLPTDAFEIVTNQARDNSVRAIPKRHRRLATRQSIVRLSRPYSFTRSRYNDVSNTNSTPADVNRTVDDVFASLDDAWWAGLRR
jgi:hypothetical protein